jgi:hypothetical protein
LVARHGRKLVSIGFHLKAAILRQTLSSSFKFESTLIRATIPAPASRGSVIASRKIPSMRYRTNTASQVLQYEYLKPLDDGVAQMSSSQYAQ